MIITKHNKHTLAQSSHKLKVLLAGNPNVGKSTIFNKLTNKHCHTGNWNGKTVECAKGTLNHKSQSIDIIDLPGTYSLRGFSPEEEVACNSIKSHDYDFVVIVMSATALERNLPLALQILMHTDKVIICLNMMDEAKKKRITPDTDELSLQLGVPVIPISAKKTSDISLLKDFISKAASSLKTYRLKKLTDIKDSNLPYNISGAKLQALAADITKQVIKNNSTVYTKRDAFLDKLFTSRLSGIPLMILLFSLIFCTTAFVANAPSNLLLRILNTIVAHSKTALEFLKTPEYISSLICDGILTTASWVISVMLPPAMIFFPLFALMEESGYLPRVAFNLDRLFKNAGLNGRVPITMLMGLGCNACGVMGCRIIHSKRERMTAIITNSFIPCNGRLPTLISLCNAFLVTGTNSFIKALTTALYTTAFLMLSVVMTLAVSKIITMIYKDNTETKFVIELPTYKRPQIFKTIADTLREKILYVTSRALLVSLPAGAIIWLLVNIKISDTNLIIYISDLLNPFAVRLGLDGVILTAFILGFPANEIVIPIIIMTYMNTGVLSEYESITHLGSILHSNGWTATTALCCCIMCLFHFPCSTTCFSIKKETNSYVWTLLSVIIPLTTGIILCVIVNTIAKMF